MSIIISTRRAWRGWSSTIAWARKSERFRQRRNFSLFRTYQLISERPFWELLSQSRFFRQKSPSPGLDCEKVVRRTELEHYAAVERSKEILDDSSSSSSSSIASGFTPRQRAHFEAFLKTYSSLHCSHMLEPKLSMINSSISESGPKSELSRRSRA